MFWTSSSRSSSGYFTDRMLLLALPLASKYDVRSKMIRPVVGSRRRSLPSSSPLSADSASFQRRHPPADAGAALFKKRGMHDGWRRRRVAVRALLEDPRESRSASRRSEGFSRRLCWFGQRTAGRNRSADTRRPTS